MSTAIHTALKKVTEKSLAARTRAMLLTGLAVVFLGGVGCSKPAPRSAKTAAAVAAASRQEPVAELAGEHENMQSSNTTAAPGPGRPLTPRPRPAGSARPGPRPASLPPRLSGPGRPMPVRRPRL